MVVRGVLLLRSALHTGLPGNETSWTWGGFGMGLGCTGTCCCCWPIACFPRSGGRGYTRWSAQLGL